MDILRRKKSQLRQKAAPPPASSLAFTPVSPTSSSGPFPSSTTAATAGNAPISKSKSQSDMTVLSTSSRTSSFDSNKSGFLQSYMPRAMRSLSRGSTSSVRPSPASTSSTSTAALSASPESPSSTSPQQHFMAHVPRKVLRKSHKRMSSHDLQDRRGSTGSDIFSRVSRASTTMSGSSSSNVLDWRVQPVEMHTPLDYPDVLPSKSRISYLVLTADFIVLFKTRADAFAALPQLADTPSAAHGQENMTSAKPSMLPPADPVHVIPLHAVISIFQADAVRPPHGIEIWWRFSYPAIATYGVTVYVKDARSQGNCLDALASIVKNKNRDQPDSPRVYYEVEECIRKIFQAEEPNFMSGIPEVFPVVYRNAPDRTKLKADDKHKKSQLEGVSSYYLVVGINLCFFIEIGRASAVQSTALEMRYQACGLVTLETFAADWTTRDERFAMRFRDPFKSPVALELSSRHYRRIILTLTKADKFLKPAWPTPWQMQEIFRVAGLPTPQHIVAGEDFGGFQRTLSAFCAAYHCDPVDWEINWRTTYAPEFRVLPSPKGNTYTDLQLLAVLRALRYNDYFKSLSFYDVDLSSLLDKYDSPRKGNVAYMSRSGVCLTTHETSLVQKASILHQEFHALAFASGKIRQIDFTNCLPAVHKDNSATHTVQFLVPILNLLAAGLTRCNRLFLRGCTLGDIDIDSLAGYLAPNDQPDSVVAPSQEAVGLEALDVANCGLSDQSMKTLFQALSQSAWGLAMLDVSQNFGRVPATMVQQFMESVGNLTQLNLSGSLSGTIDGELLPFEVLDRLEHLEQLDISNFKINESSIDALERFISNLSARQASMQNGGYAYSLRRLLLNNCGLTGHSAGRIFSAMAGLYDIHLHLGSNPLENGMEHFARALAGCWGGRFGLHLDMVEFQDEAKYIQLIGALAANKYIDYLSLVGTAPIPTTDDTCSHKTVQALDHFFAENEAVRYLDLSGFCGKLDDGQLGRGFGRALAGLAKNKTLTHLRLRNQNLHDDVDALGSAIQSFQALLYLDCGDNGFNATSLSYIARTLEANHSLLVFPLPEDELEQILKHSLKEAPLPPSPAKSTGSKQRRKSVVDYDAERQRALLRKDIEVAAAEIMSHTSRNMTNLQQATNCIVDLDEAFDTCGEIGWPSLQLRAPEGVMFTTTPLEEEADEMEIQAQLDQQGPNALLEPLSPSAIRQSPITSGQATPQITEDMPYRVPQDDEALNSPVDGVSPSWDFPATPKIALENRANEKILEKFTLADGSECFVCN